MNKLTSQIQTWHSRAAHSYTNDVARVPEHCQASSRSESAASDCHLTARRPSDTRDAALTAVALLAHLHANVILAAQPNAMQCNANDGLDQGYDAIYDPPERQWPRP